MLTHALSFCVPVNKDSSLFASREDQVSQLNIQIKDALTEIQVDQEEIQVAAQQMSRKTTAQHKKTVQAGIDTLSSRMLGIAADFKNFLQEHQRVVKKQEAKKTRIMGASAVGVAAGGGSSAKRSQVVKSGSIAEKRNRMKILPQHASQQANRVAGQRGISGTDYHRLGDEPGDHHGGALELEE